MDVYAVRLQRRASEDPLHYDVIEQTAGVPDIVRTYVNRDVAEIVAGFLNTTRAWEV